MDDTTIKNRTLRVPIDATAVRPPGRGRSWTIYAGEVGHQWSAAASTEKAAADHLATGVQNFLNAYRSPEVLHYGGYVAVVSVEPYFGDGDNTPAWRQQVINPDGKVVNHGLSAGDWNEVLASARYDLVQMSTDWHNDASVHAAAEYLSSNRNCPSRPGPDEVYRYASWQRAANAAKDAGRDDLHQWASDHSSEFPVPRPSLAAADDEIATAAVLFAAEQPRPALGPGGVDDLAESPAPTEHIDVESGLGLA